MSGYFQVGQRYVNRKGAYVVMSVDTPTLTIQYVRTGEVQEVEEELQERIVRNLDLERAGGASPLPRPEAFSRPPAKTLAAPRAGAQPSANRQPAADASRAAQAAEGGSHQGADADPSRDWPAEAEAADGSKGLGHMRREWNGWFGSYPVHDDYGDEADAE